MGYGCITIIILKNKHLDGIIIISCGLGMTTNISLNITHNLRDYLYGISKEFEPYPSLLLGEKSAENRAITFIMIHTLVNTIARWTLAKQIFINL